MRLKTAELSQWDKGVLTVQRALSAKPADTLTISSVFKFNKIYPSQKTESPFNPLQVLVVDVVELCLIRLSCSIKLS